MKGNAMECYSAGPCPVCGDMSQLSVLKATGLDLVFFFCDACGCAWGRVPKPMTVDAVQTVEKFAPNGYAFATREEIQAAGLEAFIK